MKKICACVIMLLSMVSVCCADVHTYVRFNEKTGKEVDRSEFIIEKSSLRWRNFNEDYEEYIEYQLDSQGNIVSWVNRNSKYDNDYQVVVDDAVITAHGTLKGKSFTKIFEKKDVPFCTEPKVDLIRLFPSQGDRGNFWILRTDTLAAHQMVAENKGVERIDVDGRMHDAVAIEWTVAGIFGKYFKRTYWFRPDDGILIKQRGSNNLIREVTGEENVL